MPDPSRFFTTLQRAQLEAVFEALLPGSTTNPGAGDVHAAEFVDRMLERPDSYYEIRDWQPLYVAGLAMLDAASRSRAGLLKPLESLTVEEATSLLADLAGGKLTGFPSALWQQQLFAMLRGHCIEGCLSDPRWGGNRDGAMWHWLGYPGGSAQDFGTERGDER